jgi:AraC-like DNA-binding protein
VLPTHRRDFVCAPWGHYVSGRTWLAFCHAHEAAGFVAWGRMRVEDTTALLQNLPVRGSPLKRMPCFFDVRRLEEVDPAAFGIFVEHFASAADQIPEVVERAAVVHGAGLSAALAAGFAHAALISIPMAMFTEPSEALAWLGADRALGDELDRLQAQAVGVTPLVRDMRALVGTKLGDVSLPAVAAGMGLTPRSLQRRLRKEGASFRAEVNAVRVEVAKKRLLETEDKVAEIAADVGFTSTNHFAGLFRRMTGESPAKWRAERTSRGVAVARNASGLTQSGPRLSPMEPGRLSGDC